MNSNTTIIIEHRHKTYKTSPKFTTQIHANARSIHHIPTKNYSNSHQWNIFHINRVQTIPSRIFPPLYYYEHNPRCDVLLPVFVKRFM